MLQVNKKMVDFFEKSVRNYELGEYFRFCAEQDMRNARVLNYEKENGVSSMSKRKRINAQIIYLIQQSVEKYTKSYALIIGGVDKKKLQWDINHYSYKSFLESLKQEDFTDLLSEFKEYSPNILTEDNDKIFQSISPEEGANIIKEFSEKGINSLKRMNLSKYLLKFEEAKKPILKSIKNKDFQKMVDSSYRSKWRVYIPFTSKFSVTEITKKRLISQINLLYFLYPLSFLTYFYESWTRYPTINKPHRGPKDFESNKKPIVREISNIIKKLEEINEDFLELCKPIKKAHKLEKTERYARYRRYFGLKLG